MSVTPPPLYDTVDVAVVGGGPAGLAAAAAAARGGARTLLIERYGFLGGMGTAGGVTNFAGLYGRVGGQWTLLVRGVAEELLQRIDALGGLNQPQDALQGRLLVRSYDVSAYKCAADALMGDAGADLLFHALVTDVAMDGERIDALVVQTRSGPRTVRARQFIDASGDGDVAALSGVPFDIGDGAGSGLYPTTMFRITGVDAPRALAAVGDFKAIDALMAAAAGRYSFPRRGAILRPQLDPTEWRANITQLAGDDGRALDALDARALSKGEVEGRRQIVEYMRFLRAEVPGFERARIAEIAPQVGVRETRRVRGAYALTGEDVLSSARFADCIGINAWPMELHAAGRIDWGFPRDEARAFNDLPWRMVLPQAVSNLLVAGRCASMTHEGQSAARVSGGCFVMGQAAGTAAAMCVRAGLASPTAIDVPALQARLHADGVVIDADDADDASRASRRPPAH